MYGIYEKDYDEDGKLNGYNFVKSVDSEEEAIEFTVDSDWFVYKKEN